MKHYEKPECSIKMFAVEDIITASGETPDGLKEATVKGAEQPWNDEWNTYMT